MADPARVLIVDDHAIVRFGLVQVLEPDPRFEVCGEAATAMEAKRLVTAARPNLAIVDLVLGGRDGLGLLQEIRALDTGLHVLVFSAQPEMVYARRAFGAGARGYLMKDAGVEKVPEALAVLLLGKRYASDAVQRAMFQEAAAGRGATAGSLGALSDRELQVLRLLGVGLGSAEIAAELSLSMKTVGTYRERLKAKLGADNALQLEQRAAEFVRTGTL
ncbi:MAG: response regulator transcription factor [Reyranella sp.]|nr:response regulator transcription factor [Reyranella sp.]